jgi:hypothetical protein
MVKWIDVPPKRQDYLQKRQLVKQFQKSVDYIIT